MIRAGVAACLLLTLLGAPAAAQFPWRSASQAGLDLEAGKALFERNWVGAPASTRASSGLGPLYNARSCAVCHPAGGAGNALPERGGEPGAALVVMLGEGSRLGAQLQTAALAGLRPEARIELRFEDLAVRYGDGTEVHLRRPRFTIEPEDGQPLEEGLRLSPRLAPSLHGVAALESVPAAAISELTHSGGQGEGARGVTGAGRFGLQGVSASLDMQVARALSIDLGLSSPLLPHAAGDCTPQQADCRAAAPPGTELEATAFGLLTDFVRSLAPPASAPQDPQSAGWRLFEASGCAACHTPALRAGEARPWSDLLLHEMGEDLADFTPRGEPLATRWRTAPLWGLHERREALLHDGRARSVEEAILWHGGEALSARERFRALPAADRQRLLEFLDGL